MPINPELYSGAPLQDIQVPTKAVPAVQVPAGETSLAGVLAGTNSYQQGMQQRADASAPAAEVIDSIKAATNQWVTTGALRYLQQPEFEPDDSNAYAHVQQSHVRLNDSELQWVLKANGTKQRQYRLDRVEEDQKLNKVASDSPYIAMAVAGLDPAMWAANIVSGGVASAVGLAGAARVGAAMAIDVAQTSALLAATSQTRPVSTEEVVLNTTLSALAAGLSVPRGTRKVVRDGITINEPVMVPKDPDLPTKELQEIVGVKAPEAPAPMAKATSATGDITLMKKGDEFELVAPNDEGALVSELFSSADEAKDAFDDAVDYFEGTLAAGAKQADTVTGPVASNLSHVQSAIASMGAANEGYLPEAKRIFKAADATNSVAHGEFKLMHTISEEDEHAIVAFTAKGTPIGQMNFINEPGFAPDIFIKPKYQRKGLGTAMYDYAQANGWELEMNNTLRTDAGSAFRKAYDARPRPTPGVVMFEDAGLGKSAPRVVPPALVPGSGAAPTQIAAAVNSAVQAQAKSYAQRTGSWLEWNVAKTMRNFGKAGTQVSEVLFDQQGKYGLTSAESHIRGVQAQLRPAMGRFDNLLREHMAKEGYGTLKQIFSKDAAKVQESIEQAVATEMWARQDAIEMGRVRNLNTVPKHIKEMADALDHVGASSLGEMQAAGVVGAQNLQHTSGWMNRRWDSSKLLDKIQALQAKGLAEAEAKAAIIKLVAQSMLSADAKLGTMTKELAHDIATSTINRSLRKGAYEDITMSIAQSADVTTQIRDLMAAEGLSYERAQRVVGVLQGTVDEQGKAGFLKHRIRLDHSASVDVAGVQVGVTDLLDHNVKDIFDRYVSRVSATSGFAKAGLKSSSDILALRRAGIEELSGDLTRQADFVKLFDGSIAHLQGNAVGGDIGQFMRNTAAFNRLISLGGAGYWQLTEYAAMMQQYGALKAIKYMIQEMPMFKSTLATAAKDKLFSQNLKDILENAANDQLRLQPYVRRTADGFEMPANASKSARLQHATQMVPYLNGMKWIHGHQGRVMANLVIDVLQRAAKGDAKMGAQLEKYGVTAEHMQALRPDVIQHGMQVDKWADATWHNVRPAFIKMMDEGVLHERMGDTPAFAILHPVGKFISTYRSFVFTAHNKLLAGGLQRDGFAGVGLMMMYQYPLSLMAVQAQATINGKKEMTPSKLAKAALGQMGSLGFISEVAGVLTGTKTQLGSPGTIPFDRAYAAAGEAGKIVQGKGDAARAAHSLFQLLPVMSVLAPAKAMEGLVINELKQ